MRAWILIALLACSEKQPSQQQQQQQQQQPQPPAPTEQPMPSTTPPPPMTGDVTPTDIARMSNRFALDLWAHAPEGNLAMSPASIAIALAITWGGAKGETELQMRRLLHLEGAPEALLSRWGALTKSLVDPARGLTLKLANRLYGEKTYPFDTVYFTIVRKAFDAWIEPVDFATDTEATRQKINAWVAEQTEQRIKDLLPPQTVTPSTSLVIVNAIYFLANWASKFDPKMTQPRAFWVDGTTEEKVPTMQQQLRVRYAAANGASLVELPYAGNSASMYILLPDARDGLPALEKNLAATMQSLQGALAERDVLVRLPRFTIDPPAPIQLAKTLQALGMTDAFDPTKADFTNIAKPRNDRDKLVISEVLHKAFIKVDEQGTEAAAATAVVMPRGGRPSTPTMFAADHPFLFVIADRATGMMLFIGRVTSPAS